MLPTLDFQQAKANHLLFKSRLRAILYGEGDASDTRVLSQYACAVGKWLYTHALIHYESIPEVYKLEEVHGQLHRLARELVNLYQQGNVTEARLGLSEMEQRADQVVDLLQIVEAKVKAIDSSPDMAVKPDEPTDGNQALQALLAQNELLNSQIRQQADQSLYNFFMQAPASFCILRGPDHVYELANPEYQQLIGGRNPLGQPIRQALPELEGQGFYELLDTVYTTQRPFAGKNVQLTLLNVSGQSRVAYVDFIYQPTIDSQGKTDGILVFAYEVTEQVLARQTIEKSEYRFRSLVEEAPVATCLLTGRELRIEVANQSILAIWGKGREVIGKPLAMAVPELEGQPFLHILDDVFTTAKAYSASNALVTHKIDGVLKDVYVDFDYKPLLGTDGLVASILVTATNVTDKVIASRKLEESEVRFRTIVEQAPVAIALLSGKDMIVETANEAVLASWGKDATILGKPIRQALPELEGQPFLALLSQVYSTGELYSAYAAPARLMINGKLEDVYYDFIYTPIRNVEGIVTGVMVLATVVTEQVLARQKVERAEASLRGAVELAELGTWQIDLTTGILDYSERLRAWCGIGPDEIITIERAYRPIREEDRPLVKASMTHAMTPGTNGIYDVEYTLDATQAGRERIIHAQGKAFFDEEGKAYTISGTAQDVTEQRSIQLALEHRVQERTEELAATNEELAAINEELTAASEEIVKANKGLEEANLHLTRSNQNLQQFAYIASHDLQEPLRKIQQFGDLLRNRYETSFGEGLVYLERMQSAASRMSLLIKDLLSFSRISTRQVVTASVSLSQVVDEALDNLSVAIGETNAHIEVDALPTVQGDASQLGQLFLNLLSNAIKFSRKSQSGESTVPHITVRATALRAEDLPVSVKPARQTMAYLRIDVADNGIGFDEKYRDRIFQVFQRLHGKNEFAGTGVGLAICEKVVVNHGGAITATSKPGSGATFSVYLPL
ncbi:PAS domain-containing protein [Spirosoma sp. HMF4905]|uniref:histidine kinase n=1 Tax=Spirosoma arboris TaxID=2682092 RepID=A0A7K1S992_9BACT|nr:PAS domain-containing protein [Spirosoma arboris]MVM30325.1 PAS domain-containing protein [Spirosoma arboris]